MSKQQEKSQTKNPTGKGSRPNSDDLFIKKLNILRDMQAQAVDCCDAPEREETERMSHEDSDSRCEMELSKALVEHNRWRQSLEERKSELVNEIEEQRLNMRTLVDAYIQKQEKDATERLRIQGGIEKIKSENDAKVTMFKSSLQELHAAILEVLNEPRYLPTEVFARDVERFLAT